MQQQYQRVIFVQSEVQHWESDATELTWTVRRYSKAKYTFITTRIRIQDIVKRRRFRLCYSAFRRFEEGMRTPKYKSIPAENQSPIQEDRMRLGLVTLNQYTGLRGPPISTINSTTRLGLDPIQSAMTLHILHSIRQDLLYDRQSSWPRLRYRQLIVNCAVILSLRLTKPWNPRLPRPHEHHRAALSHKTLHRASHCALPTHGWLADGGDIRNPFLFLVVVDRSKSSFCFYALQLSTSTLS